MVPIIGGTVAGIISNLWGMNSLHFITIYTIGLIVGTIMGYKSREHCG